MSERLPLAVIGPCRRPPPDAHRGLKRLRNFFRLVTTERGEEIQDRDNLRNIERKAKDYPLSKK